MNISQGSPPNWAEIERHFPSVSPRTVAVYGDTLYMRGNGEPSEDLKAHEAMHVIQQKAAGGPGKWWAKYFEDPQFRLVQELDAYRAQYRKLQLIQRDRNKLAAELTRLAHDLSGPNYGKLMTLGEAMKAIRGQR